MIENAPPNLINTMGVVEWTKVRVPDEILPELKTLNNFPSKNALRYNIVHYRNPTLPISKRYNADTLCTLDGGTAPGPARANQGMTNNKPLLLDHDNRRCVGPDGSARLRFSLNFSASGGVVLRITFLIVIFNRLLRFGAEN